MTPGPLLAQSERSDRRRFEWPPGNSNIELSLKDWCVRIQVQDAAKRAGAVNLTQMLLGLQDVSDFPSGQFRPSPAPLETVAQER